MKSDIQKFGVLKHRAGHRSYSQLLMALVLLVGWVPLQAGATTTDVRFQKYLKDICSGAITAPPGVVWDTTALNAMCTNTANGFIMPRGTAPVSVGTGGGAVRSNKVFRQRLDEEKEQPKEKGASADGGKWGLLFSPQYSKSNRPETELENGFSSKLKGIAIGLDHRFSDAFVLGALLGHTRDDAAFLNSASSLKTSNNTFTMYGTWLASDSVAVDGYLGYGKVKLDSQRHVVGSSINSTATGNTTGKQTMVGFSASYQKDFGQVNISPFINLDGVKTKFDGYNETGTTTLELHYSDRNTLSVTSSVGARASTTYSYDWGTLLPSVRVAAVHEYQSNASNISNELVITPGAGFLVATDAPDRNYLSAGLGVAAALNGGAQLFLNYEKRMKDKLLDSWAVSGGVLVEF